MFAVRNCPKPPPTRVSLGFAAINTAEEVWIIAAGEGKAPAVALALSGAAGPVQIPAAGVHGTRATRWLLDAAAAVFVTIVIAIYAIAGVIVYAALGLAAGLASVAALRLLAARRGGVSEARAHAGGRR